MILANILICVNGIRLMFFLHINHISGLDLVTSIKHEDKNLFYKWGLSLLYSWTNDTNMTNIKPRQAWQMALPLFNGVVKLGYGLKTPFQCGVGECGSIKSRFPCGVTCKHLFCNHLAKDDSWQLPVTIFFSWQTDFLGPWTHSETETEKSSLFIHGSCVAQLQTPLMLDGPSRWRAAGVVIITQQIGQFPHQLWSSRMEIWWAGKC